TPDPLSPTFPDTIVCELYTNIATVHHTVFDIMSCTCWCSHPRYTLFNISGL
ncbi:hypothetical protein L9F63_023901, partial [Diploptera punctata]